MAGCSQKPADTKQAGDQSWNKIKAKGEFVVGLDDNYPPAGFRDKQGDLVGFDIDLAKEAAKRLGVKAVFKPVQWDGVLLNLKSGDIDLIWNALGITPERQKEIGFTDSYMADRNIIVVKSGSPIKTKADLEGKIIGLQLGSTAEPAVTKDSISSKLEIIRAGIESIDKGQYEAAKALGMTYVQTMRRIIIPQTIRRVLPATCNEAILTFKDTALVADIGMGNLLRWV